MKVILAKKCLLLCAIFALLGGCESKKARVPQHLVGLWKTTAPKYSDRFFRITTDHIVLGIGEGRSDIHRIVGVKEAQEEGLALYTIFYLNEEAQEYRFSFYLDTGKESIIRFRNQPEILWTKEEP